MKEIRMLKEKGKPDGVKEKTDGLLAAMKIQKLWRGFATRRKTRRRKLEEMYLIGMIPRPLDKPIVPNEEMENVSFLHAVIVSFDVVTHTIRNRRRKLDMKFKKSFKKLTLKPLRQ